MGRVAGAGGVQDPEVEPARHGGRVGQREVLLDGPALEAAAVDRDAERVEAQGAGDLAPRASNLTEAGREQNRRVEVVVLSAE